MWSVSSGVVSSMSSIFQWIECAHIGCIDDAAIIGICGARWAGRLMAGAGIRWSAQSWIVIPPRLSRRCHIHNHRVYFNVLFLNETNELFFGFLVFYTPLCFSAFRCLVERFSEISLNFIRSLLLSHTNWAVICVLLIDLFEFLLCFCAYFTWITRWPQLFFH